MVYDPKSAGIERYIDLVNKFSRSFTTRPTPSTSDPYPSGFNNTTGAFEYWNGTSWIQLTTPPIDHGLLEPGLILYNDPYNLDESDYGFDQDPENPGLTPAFLVTSRVPYESEDIKLLITVEDGGDPIPFTQPAVIWASVPLNDALNAIMNVYSFDLKTPGYTMYSPTTFTETYIAAVLGIYDNSENRWVDKITVHVRGGGPL